ncbi:hypothetical protein WN943_022086 [Citrus x changshan-huyou]
MCGGAIVADYIPPTVPGRPKKLTAEYLWPLVNLTNLQVLNLSDNENLAALDVVAYLALSNFHYRLNPTLAAVKDVEATAVKLSPGSSSMKGGKIVWSDGKHNATSPIVVTMHARL